MQGDQLKSIRTQAGLSQEEFATHLGMTPTFIGLMERGQRPIELRTAWAALMIEMVCIRNEERAALEALEPGSVLNADYSTDMTGAFRQLAEQRLARIEAAIDTGVRDYGLTVPNLEKARKRMVTVT